MHGLGLLDLSTERLRQQRRLLYVYWTKLIEPCLSTALIQYTTYSDFSLLPLSCILYELQTDPDVISVGLWPCHALVCQLASSLLSLLPFPPSSLSPVVAFPSAARLGAGALAASLIVSVNKRYLHFPSPPLHALMWIVVVVMQYRLTYDGCVALWLASVVRVDCLLCQHTAVVENAGVIVACCFPHFIASLCSSLGLPAPIAETSPFSNPLVTSIVCFAFSLFFTQIDFKLSQAYQKARRHTDTAWSQIVVSISHSRTLTHHTIRTRLKAGWGA